MLLRSATVAGGSPGESSALALLNEIDFKIDRLFRV